MHNLKKFLIILSKVIQPKAGTRHGVTLNPDNKMLELTVSVEHGFKTFTLEESDFNKDPLYLAREIESLLNESI